MNTTSPMITTLPTLSPALIPTQTEPTTKPTKVTVPPPVISSITYFLVPYQYPLYPGLSPVAPPGTGGGNTLQPMTPTQVKPMVPVNGNGVSSVGIFDPVKLGIIGILDVVKKGIGQKVQWNRIPNLLGTPTI